MKEGNGKSQEGKQRRERWRTFGEQKEGMQIREIYEKCLCIGLKEGDADDG